MRRTGLVLLGCLWGMSGASGEVLKMTEGQRLWVSLGTGGVTRVSVKEDRLTSWVSGDRRVVVEMDEGTGHAFVRPLASHGEVFGTFGTERGQVQDVVFRIRKGAPESVIMGSGEKEPPVSRPVEAEGMKDSGVRARAVALVQRIVAGEGEKAKGSVRSSSGAEGFRERRLLEGDLEASLYRTKDGGAELSLWRQEGDIAVALWRGRLVVVRRRG